jgi:hypothetical protein
MSYFAAHRDQLAPEPRPIIERCLTADPARRPTAAEFLTELNALRASTPPVSDASAHPAGNRWQAAKLNGEITWNIASNPNGNCGGGQVVLGVSG